MSVHGTSQIKCAICALQAPLQQANQDWWLCTTCGSYVCPDCYALFHSSEQGNCPGSIVRGTEIHPPHFTRFLSPRQEDTPPQETERSTVVILGDVRREARQQTPPPPGGRVIILDDEEDQEAESEERIGSEDED